MNYAVALAVRIGADATATRLGMQARTVRRWCERAGTAPADAIVTADWASLGSMARAQVEADLTSGKLTAVQAATIAAIADRNAAKPEPTEEHSAVATLDSFIDWVLDAGHATNEDDFGALKRELIIRANREPGQPHRQAMLAWSSGRPEIPAGDALPWAQDQTKALLAEHGSLEGLREWRARGDAEQDAADLVMKDRVWVASLWAAQGFPAAECWTRATDGPPGLDAKALELLDQA